MHVECHLQALRGGGFAGCRHADGRHAGGWRPGGRHAAGTHAGGRHAGARQRVSARGRPRAVRNSAYGLVASCDGLEEAPLAPSSALLRFAFQRHCIFHSSAFECRETNYAIGKVHHFYRNFSQDNIFKHIA